MASSLLQPGGLDVDPILSPPAPLQGKVSVTLPGPGGEGGTVPQDPSNGEGVIVIDAWDTPAGGGATGGGSGGGAQTVGSISCYEFHYTDYICNGVKATAYFGGYYVGGTIGNLSCDSSGGNGGAKPSIGPGVPGTGCASIYSGPNGVQCAPSCDGGSGADGGSGPGGSGGAGNGSDIPTGMMPVPVPPPLAGNIGGGGAGGGAGGASTPNNTPGGVNSSSNDFSPGSGTGLLGPGGSNQGGSYTGAISTGGGGRNEPGPGIFDYPPNNGTGRRSFKVEISDGQTATAQLDPGDFVRVVRNADGTLIIGKVSRQNGKTFFIEIQRIQPASVTQDGQLDLSEQNAILQAQATQLNARVNQLTAQISKIVESSLTDGTLDHDIYYPTTTPPLVAGVTKDGGALFPKVNGGVPEKPNKKKKEQSSSDGKGSPGNSSPGGGGGGGATQVVIVQDDSSQSFVRIS